jgi:SAM-dependent methyltransferase
MDLKELRMHWDAFGRQNPFRAILTNKADWEQDEFFETGHATVAAVMSALDADGLGARRARALDFGCGAGRLTRALGRFYDESIGVDIAPSMIDLAIALNEGHPGCRFALNERGDLSQFENASFDLVLSLITLQHMRPEYAKGYIREFVRLLHPDGVLVMQIPGERIPKPSEALLHRRAGRRLAALVPAALRERVRRARYRRRLAKRPKMEMYAIPPAEVAAFVEALGARVIRVAPEGEIFGRWTSVWYTVAKSAA